MGKQIDKKDSTLFAVSFNKSIEEQWLYATVMEMNTETNFIPGGSKLIKTALRKYLSDLGFAIPDKKIIKNMPKIQNSEVKKPIETKKEEIVESPKVKEVVKKIEVVNNPEQNIQDEEPNIIG